MRVNFLLLSNFASQLSNGSPVIAGVFRGIQVGSLPSRLDPFFLATEIEADPHETGRQEFIVRLIDQDGVSVYENKIEAEFDERPNYLPSYMYFCGQVFIEKEIKATGLYRFDLVWNDETIGESRLEIAL